MKIRIKGNSVRYRLTKTEVETFCKEGFYKEETVFDNSTLSYIIKTKEGITELEATYTDNSITIFVPKQAIENWASNSQVGFKNSADWNDESALSLLVEKDFICMDSTLEDQSDNYPNPRLQ
ncbi:hypothetical protein ABN763_06565 [Spongiivirga sp. MCCC 1A20706]|uniref:DUF7009 family protein n=1 Tax=Spongiivirga sp. MCCC 1A20706 TaxID=3160963 RepID=UPI003977913F